MNHEFFMRNSGVVFVKQIFLGEARNTFIRAKLSHAGRDLIKLFVRLYYNRRTQNSCCKFIPSQNLKFYDCCRKRILRSKSLLELMHWFVGMVQVYMDRIATTVNANDATAITADLVLQNV